jgi:hypothetical protein
MGLNAAEPAHFTAVDSVPRLQWIASMKAIGFSAKAAFCCAAALGMTEVQAREVSGVTMPEAVRVEGEDLRLNGMGVRREMVLFKAYVIALYLEKPTTEGRIAIRTDEARRVVITMLRDVGREVFVQAIESGVMRNSGPAAMATLRARLDLLERAVPDLRRGDVLDLTWVPGAGTLVVRGQGRTLTISGKDFADALFAVWLGPKPVEDTLKRALLGG